MTTCMVARKRDGCSVRRNSFAAFLFPSCAIFSSLASLQETTAISAQANTALTAINTTCKRILPTMSLSKRFKPPQYYLCVFQKCHIGLLGLVNICFAGYFPWSMHA